MFSDPRVSSFDSTSFPAAAWSQDDAPTSELDKKEPEWHCVESGETLWELSRRYQIPLALLEQVNKQRVPDAKHMGIGTWVRIPLKPGGGAPPVIEAVPADAIAGLPRPWLDEFSQTHAKTARHIEHANWHVLRKPDADVAGKSIWVPGGASAPLKIAAARAAGADDNAPPHAPPLAALHGVLPAQKQPQAARPKQSPGNTASIGTALVDRRSKEAAEAWATASKALDEAAKEKRPGTSSPAHEATRQLDIATRGLNADQVVQVVQAALPALAAYDKTYREHYSRPPLDKQSMTTMLKVLDRAANSPAAPDLFKRYAKLGHWDEAAMAQAIAQGSPPDYLFALIEQGGTTTQRLLQPLIGELQKLNRRSAQAVGEWAQHDAKRVFMEPNLGGTMTPDMRRTALDEYHKNMGAEWQAERTRLRERMDEQGKQFIIHKALLLSSMERFPSLPKASQAQLHALLNDKLSVFAAQTAQENPNVIRGVNWEALLARFYTDLSYVSSFKLSDQGRKFGAELAMGVVRSLFYKRLDLAALASKSPGLIDDLDEILKGITESPMARIFGVSAQDMNRSVSAMRRVIGDKLQLRQDSGYLKTLAGSEAEAMNKFQKEVQKDIQAELKKINGFNVSTPAGKFFRAVGWGLSGVSFYGAWVNATAKPHHSLLSAAPYYSKALIETGGVVQKSIELFGAFNLLELTKGSALERIGGSAAARVLTRFSIGHELWKAGDAYVHGHTARGNLLLGYASGQAIAAFGKAVPKNNMVGAIVAGASLAGLMLVEGVERKLAHDPEHDGRVALRFLMHSGMKEAVARVMLQPSGDGHCVVPLWVRYMELNGTDFDNAPSQSKAIAWLNKLGDRQLNSFCDDMRDTMDGLEGEPSKLTAQNQYQKPISRWPMATSLWSHESDRQIAHTAKELNDAAHQLGIAPPGNISL